LEYSGLGGVAIAERRTATGGDLLDLATGRRAPYTVANASSSTSTYILHCGMVGCIGCSGKSTVVQPLDGSRLLTVGVDQLSPLGDGRFLWATFSATHSAPYQVIVWDRITGRAVICFRSAAVAFQPGTDRVHVGRRFLTWPT
jgi:hypothetical protein